MKELACFASGIFTYSANLAFRIFAILFDFALMVTFACIADPQWSVCSIVQRKVLDLYNEDMPSHSARFDKKWATLDKKIFSENVALYMNSTN